MSFKMMFSFLVFSMVSFSSASHAYSCRVDMIDSRGRVVDTFYAQRDPRGTCRDGLRDCMREIHRRPNSGYRCVQNNNPRPIPTPIPNPRPTPAPIPGGNYYNFNTSVIIRNDLYEFRSSRPADLYTECVMRLDEINVSNIFEFIMVTNNSPVQKISIPGWLSTSDKICQKIVENVNFDQYSRRLSLDVYGSIHQKSFRFYSTSKSDTLAQCHTTYLSGKTSAFEFFMGVNNSVLKKYRIPGWLSDASNFCLTFMRAIDEIVP